jgi:hypothetical protein
MTDSNAQKPKSSTKPTFHAYHVRDREGGDGFWTRIGSAWRHKDGDSYNLLIENVPLDGRIILRVYSEKTK